MTARFDVRTLRQLCSDNNTPVPEADLPTDPKMLASLDDATGAMKAALLIGNQYSTDDLDDLTGESLAYRKRICCEIALSYLIRRRPEKYGKASKEVKEGVDEILEQFRNGARVFDVDANRKAGTPTIDGPRAVDYERLNLMPERTRNFYPSRQSRLPIGR